MILLEAFVQYVVKNVQRYGVFSFRSIIVEQFLWSLTIHRWSPDDVGLHTNPNVEYLIILMNGKPFKGSFGFKICLQKNTAVGYKIQRL